MRTETERAELRAKAANLRCLAAQQDANAAAHRRQAGHPIYPGQEGICDGKAAQIEAYAAKSRADADLLDAQANE
jgi:hypothetical protein